MTKLQFRQGDLLIQQVETFMRDRLTEKIKDGIVQHGEATGHSHRLLGGDAFNVRGVVHLESDGNTKLVHDEHDTIELPEGKYRVLRQREFTPEGERNVRD